MLQNLRRMRENEEGFTLIELMVVVLIIAILIAIAIPTFLGAQDRARDRAAQSDLRNAFTAAKSIATDFEGFWKIADTCGTNPSSDLAGALESENASLAYGAGVTASETSISVNVDTACKLLLLQRASTSGKVFCLASDQNGNVLRDQNAEATPLASFAAYTNCDAPDGW